MHAIHYTHNHNTKEEDCFAKISKKIPFLKHEKQTAKFIIKRINMLLCGWPKRKNKQNRHDTSVSPIEEQQHGTETSTPESITAKSDDSNQSRHTFYLN